MLDAGAPMSYQAIAEKMGISRQAVWEMLRKPDVAAWIDTVLRTSNKGRVAGVIGRLGSIAERSGSVKHAELFLRTQGEIHDEPQAGAGNVVIQVIGIPNTAAPGEWVGGYLPDAKR